MNTRTAGCLIIFGNLVILPGVIGHVTRPEKAITALICGGGFGALWMLWGILSAEGVRWGWLAALAANALLALACVWRASVSWLAVVDGQLEKAFPSALLAVTLAVSAAMLLLLLKDRKAGGVEKPAGGPP